MANLCSLDLDPADVKEDSKGTATNSAGIEAARTTEDKNVDEDEDEDAEMDMVA